MSKSRRKSASPASEPDPLHSAARSWAGNDSGLASRTHQCLTRLRDALSTPDSDEVEVRNEVLALLNVGGLEIGLARFVGSLLALPSSDLAALPGRIRSMQYLFHFETPFHTLAELTDRLVAFRAFDDEVREYLLRTGLQPKPFAASPWFDRMLGRLYGTRCTSRPFPFPRKPPYQFLRCGDPYNPKTLAYKACKCEDASFLTAC